MYQWFLFIILAMSFVTAASSPAVEIEVVRTLGADGDDIFLHNPMSVQIAEDGTWFMINAGECQVLHLDSNWELINSFGRCGEGPGEFENPRGMVLYKGEVWVFGMARITVYGQDGEFRRSLVPGLQYQAVTLLDGRLAAVMGAGNLSSAFLTDEGTVEEAFGTSCSDDFFESFKACRNQQILPCDEGRCLLLNPISGKVWLIDDQGEVAWEKNLVTLEENAHMSESDDGETVTLSVSFLTGNASLSPKGNYWFTIPSEEEDGPTSLRVTDGQLNRLREDIVLPDEINGYEVFFTPDGLVGLVSTGESVVHLCRIDLIIPDAERN